MEAGAAETSELFLRGLRLWCPVQSEQLEESDLYSTSMALIHFNKTWGFF